MALYCIGDVHACLSELEKMLLLINFDQNKDHILFTGDIIGRGPDALGTVKLIRSLGDRATFVLGNHDMNFLAVSYGFHEAKPRDKLDKLLKSPLLPEIIEWFCSHPFFYEIPDKKVAIVHAGIDPSWTFNEALQYSHELENLMKNKGERLQILSHMYSDEPNKWSSELTGLSRSRFLLNVFTRIRFCKKDGSLDFDCKYAPEEAVHLGLKPWYDTKEIPFQDQNNTRLVFGHWAALQGKCFKKNISALDTGCIWGGKLTCINMDTRKTYTVKSNEGIPLLNPGQV